MNHQQITTTAQDRPMSIPFVDDEEYRKSCAHHKAVAEQERAEIARLTGVRIEDSGRMILPPRTLAEIILMPLRVTAPKTSAEQDRKSRLAVLIAELIEEGYSTIEIRSQCDFEDAAAESDGY
jgi:hypothetical protein